MSVYLLPSLCFSPNHQYSPLKYTEMRRKSCILDTNFCTHRTARQAGEWEGDWRGKSNIYIYMHFCIICIHYIYLYVCSQWNILNGIHPECILYSCLQVVKSLIALLRYYAWNKFSILYEEVWGTVADLLKDQAIKKNMTINHKHPFIDDYGKCCELGLPCCRSGYWYQVGFNLIEV